MVDIFWNSEPAVRAIEQYLFSIVRNILKFENLQAERAAFRVMLIFEKKKAIFKKYCCISGLF